MDDIVAHIFSTSFAFSIIRVTTPILFAALAAFISDKAGVINIGIEGIMLLAAFLGVIGSWLTESAVLGLLIALVGAVFLSFVMAYFVLTLKTNVILAGIALNIFSSGVTIFLLDLLAGSKGISNALKSYVLPNVEIPLLKDIPVLGEIISNHNILTYLAFLMVIGTYFFLFKSVFGIRIRVVGESPDAAKSVGVSVVKNQYVALMISGLLAGFGGAYMSMGYVSWFSANMTAGRGFIALAAAAMGSTPVGIFFASLFFGITDALSNAIQSLSVPPEFIRMTPYLLTIIAITLYAIREKRRKLRA